MAGTADDVSTPDSGNVWLDSIMWGTEWSSGTGATTVVSVYIAGQGGEEPVGHDAAEVWATIPSREEHAAMLAAMASLEKVCNIDFQLVTSAGHADVIWASVDALDAGEDILGWADPPGTTFNSGLGDAQSLVAINYELYDPGTGPNVLVKGGYDYLTYIHELGHAVGLAHPHDDGGGSTIFPGVGDPDGDGNYSRGAYGMNQGIHTMMSYNDGWQTGPRGESPSVLYGYQSGPMALDIAALQRMYGANMSVRTGNDTYTLPTANKIGTYYSCIWDAGGVDRIIGGDHGNIIDLRAATLANAPGGGGYVSHANNGSGGFVHGGFTIANQVVIENATGGAGRDAIRGNGADNTLLGLGGQDRLNGGHGNDALHGGSGGDTLAGGAGNDRLVGGVGMDRLDGGAGFDDIVFRAAADSTGSGRDEVTGFSRSEDEIVLTAIDANGGQAGNGAFRLDTGGAFARGEIRQTVTGGNLLLQLNLDSDPTAEMSILLLNLTSRLGAEAFAL